MTNTEIAAYIGAITGSLALAWNIVKQILKSRASMRIDLFEGKFSSTTAITEITYRIEIFNNGPPVAIRVIYLETRERRFWGLWSKRIDTIADFGSKEYPLPQTLGEGGKLIMEQHASVPLVNEYLKRGKIFVAVYHSRARKPKLIRSRDRAGIVSSALKRDDSLRKIL